jgi:hypothetical protein
MCIRMSLRGALLWKGDETISVEEGKSRLPRLSAEGLAMTVRKFFDRLRMSGGNNVSPFGKGGLRGI